MNDRLQYSWLLAFLCIFPLACGSRSVVTGPQDDSPDTSATPEVKSKPVDREPRPAKTDRELGTSPPIPSRKIPPIKGFDELKSLIAEISGDAADRPPLKRVWSRSDGVAVVLNESQVTDDGLAKLKRIPNLRNLNLAGCIEITSAGIAHLRSIGSLRTLNLSKTMIDDDALRHVSEMKHLEELVLSLAKYITNDGLAYLSGCKSLSMLKLIDTNISDAGLQHLKRLPNLQKVWLSGSRVTANGLRELQAARPKMKIFPRP